MAEKAFGGDGSPIDRRTALGALAGTIFGGVGSYLGFKPKTGHVEALERIAELEEKNAGLAKRLKEVESELARKNDQFDAFQRSNLDDIILKNKPYEYDFTDYFNRWENRGAEELYEHIKAAIDKHKDIYWVDSMLVLALVKRESGNGFHLISRTGAAGSFQLMPTTAEYPEEIGRAKSKDEVEALVKEAIREGKRPYLRVWRGSSYESAKKADDDQRDAFKTIRDRRASIARIEKYYLDRVEDPTYDKLQEWLDKVDPRNGNRLRRLIREENTARIKYFEAQKREKEWNDKYKEELKSMYRLKNKEMIKYTDERMDDAKAADAAILYLAHLSRTCEGNLVRILSMYNSGEMIVPEYDETRKYIDAIISDFLTGVRLYRKDNIKL